MDNKHNSLNLALKICSDISPCTLSVTIFLELRSRKTVRFSEQIMSADKYPSIFSRQMKAIVYLFSARSNQRLGNAFEIHLKGEINSSAI